MYGRKGQKEMKREKKEGRGSRTNGADDSEIREFPVYSLSTFVLFSTVGHLSRLMARPAVSLHIPVSSSWLHFKNYIPL